MTDIERLKELNIPKNCEMYGTIQRAIKVLEQEPKTGKWIDKKCSVCGWHINPWIEEYNFCPNCGAKMESEGK